MLYLSGNPIFDVHLSHLCVLNLPRMGFFGINVSKPNFAWDCLMGNWKSLSYVQIGKIG